MISVHNHLMLLGHEVEDVVSKRRGVVTSITFDLYGCVQALLSARVGKDGKEPVEAQWFDVKRLKMISKMPCMARPDFIDVPGPQRKPRPMRTPIPR